MHNADILDDAAELEQQMIEIALANRNARRCSLPVPAITARSQ